MCSIVKEIAAWIGPGATPGAAMFVLMAFAWSAMMIAGIGILGIRALLKDRRRRKKMTGLSAQIAWEFVRKIKSGKELSKEELEQILLMLLEDYKDRANSDRTMAGPCD